MYNSKDGTIDEDLTFLSYNQTINAEFTVEEILTSDLWVTNDDNGLVKAIPLFNCDSIQSNNPNDIILDDNKCVILNNDDNTIITAKSDDTGSMHIYDVILHAYAPYTVLDVSGLYIYCIVYDEYMNLLTNTVISVKKDGTVIDTVKTDYDGVCEYKVDEAGSYKFIYDEIESETITINSGE